MLGNLFLTLYFVLNIYFYVLIFYIIGSWIPELRNTSLYQFITKLADPYMRIFRGLLVYNQLDFTPILGFILYRFLLDGVYRLSFIL